MGDNQSAKPISELTQLLVIGGVLGAFNWVRSGPVAGIAAVAGLATALFIAHLIRGRRGK